jgi:hypothetical protein
VPASNTSLPLSSPAPGEPPGEPEDLLLEHPAADAAAMAKARPMQRALVGR